MIIQTLEIRTTKTWLKQKIEVVQGDSGRILKCIVTDMQIPINSTARIYAIKPSKKEVYNNCTIEGNTVSTKLTTQVTAEIGIVACQIEVLSQSKEKVTSFEFDIDVKKSIASASSIESKDEYTALVESLVSVEELKRNGLKGDNGEKGDTGPGGPTGPKGETGSVDNDAPINFTEATSRVNIASGESILTIFGKIKKWFTDLKTVAFTGSYTDLINSPTVKNDLSTTENGSILDARQGKVLNDSKFNKSNVVASTSITQSGYVMDGKTASEAIALLKNDLTAKTYAATLVIGYNKLNETLTVRNGRAIWSLNITCTLTTIANHTYNMGTLPLGVRPKKIEYIPFMMANNNGGDGVTGLLTLAPTGSVEWICPTTQKCFFISAEWDV